MTKSFSEATCVAACDWGEQRLLSAERGLSATSDFTYRTLNAPVRAGGLYYPDVAARAQQQQQQQQPSASHAGPYVPGDYAPDSPYAQAACAHAGSTFDVTAAQRVPACDLDSCYVPTPCALDRAQLHHEQGFTRQNTRDQNDQNDRAQALLRPCVTRAIRTRDDLARLLQQQAGGAAAAAPYAPRTLPLFAGSQENSQHIYDDSNSAQRYRMGASRVYEGYFSHALSRGAEIQSLPVAQANTGASARQTDPAQRYACADFCSNLGPLV